ncbi:MAG TPA: molecular chaperone Hsp33, partial [Erythrobacter sp.]|nr:molecular chaperone Hsp33 [Erythrobacter sp.]HCO47669.1 molecular chaperone Hsp33 [Erythrobacter sp.]
CRCSVEHYRSVLERFPEDQRVEMRDPDGIVRVDCAFCSKQFEITV